MKRTLAVVVCALVLATMGCTVPGKRTAIGAGTGAAFGAGVGAIIGHQSGEKGKGAAVGAVVGSLLGGGIGNYLDKQAKELEQIAETKRTEDSIITTLKNNILFDTGKANLKPEALESINQIADIIKKYPEDKIIVIGHTDNVGSDVFNQRLSEQRAQAVRLAMIARGVPSGSIEQVGMGESNPIDSNDIEAGRARNRRVELQITVDESKLH